MTKIIKKIKSLNRLRVTIWLRKLSQLSFALPNQSVRLSNRERTMLIKRLSFLIKAGVSMVESLHMLKSYTRSPSKTKMLEHIIRDVENGQYLYTSLAKYRRAFGNFSINLIKVGEMSGVLGQNLDYLAQELQKKHQLQRKVFSALVYPFFIIGATLSITGVLMAFVFPRVLPIFASLNVKLPLTTKILIVVSSFVIHNGLWLLLGLVALIILFFVLLRRLPGFRFWIDHLILRLPLLGRLTQYYQLTNFCRTLGLMLKSGVRSVEAIEITAETMGNVVYRRTVKKLAKSVIEGQRLSFFLAKHHSLFPDLVLQMIAIGETTGNLSDTLIYLSDMYEGEVEEMTKNLSSAIEPVLMIFMGLLVGFIAISIITPIYEITKGLSPRR